VLSFTRLFEVTEEREPSVWEISEGTNIPYEVVEDVLRYTQPVSGFEDQLDPESAASRCSAPSYEADTVVAEVMKEELSKIFDIVLSDVEKYVLRSRFAPACSMHRKDLALRLGVNIQEIINIEKSAYRKVRQYFTENGLDFHDFLPSQSPQT
jgi:DNA-directed RNA polymerase sigma subunit (sigma70/sigma32)